MTQQQHWFKNAGSTFGAAMLEERNTRAAHDALRDIFAFFDALDREVDHAMRQASTGKPLNQQLLDVTRVAKERLNQLFEASKKPNSMDMQHALIALADAIQDVIRHQSTTRH